MASGPYFDKRRGTYSIQWYDGRKWRRVVVWKVPGWKVGRETPKKVPPEALAAVAVYAEKEKAARRNRPMEPGRTVADFLGAYQAAYRRDHPATSAEQLDFAAVRFLAWCGRKRVALAAEVSPATCQGYVDDRGQQTSKKTGRPISAGRLAQERALLSGAWRRAVRIRELPENPWSSVAVPGIEAARRAKRPKPSWSPEEFVRLLAACRPWLRDLLTVGTQTGLRIGALTGLEWRDVKWGRGEGAGFGHVEVRVELDKAGKGYRVPISATCHDVLARRFVHKGAETDRVLTGMHGGAVMPRVAARSIVQACRRAGLPKPVSPTHHCRRTFGRWAVLGHLTGRPVPLYVVSKWLGHGTVKMTEEYLDLRIDESVDWMAGRGDGQS
jgi:integrase